ncbi:hypothetical protein [Streptomyces sp. NA04227]|uniref:hypothetical protein n=1 Tax=Streptomyces sp. NA04227 TaxID=2742136 RepID=UPI0020CA6CC3|nr:hypothetical protein [Streptomyces sp. NA04227]
MMSTQIPLSGDETLYAAVTALLGLVLLYWCLRKLSRSTRLGTPAVRVAAFAAVCCTAYSADTSWRFAADFLDMGSVAERVAMFSAAEVALFATALLARQNLHGPKGAPGAPGVLVWVITGVQIIPAYAESGLVGGTVRAFIGPVMAAMLWHQAMGIELRHSKPGTESNGLTAVIGRELRERLLSRLGVAERDRDAAQITRDRATARAVALASRLAEQTPEQQGSWRGRRTARRLSVAVAKAAVGDDARQRRSLLDQLAARRHAVGLATIELPSPWEEFGTDPAASALAAQVRNQMRHATDEIRRNGHPALLFADVGAGQRVNTVERSPERAPGGEAADEETRADQADQADKLPTATAQAVIHECWGQGLTVRETAKRATRAPSYVHSVFVKLDKEQGVRPGPGQLALVNSETAGSPAEEALQTADS